MVQKTVTDARFAPGVSEFLIGSLFGGQHLAHGVQLAGAAELFVLPGDELGVFGHENLADRAKVEILGVLAESTHGERASTPGVRPCQC